MTEATTTAFVRGRKAHINVTLDIDQVIELDRIAEQWGGIGRSAVVRIAVGKMLRENSSLADSRHPDTPELAVAS